MDIVDKSFEEEQAYLNHKIKHSVKKVHNIRPDGYCHFCFEEVEENKLFCNKKCADAYELNRRFG